MPFGIGVGLTDSERADLTSGYQLIAVDAASLEAEHAEDTDAQDRPLAGHGDDDGGDDDDGTDRVAKKRNPKKKQMVTNKKKAFGKGKYFSLILLLFNNINIQE
jgi:hypothetical protein